MQPPTLNPNQYCPCLYKALMSRQAEFSQLLSCQEYRQSQVSTPASIMARSQSVILVLLRLGWPCLTALLHFMQTG